MDFFRNLLNTEGFNERWYCGDWSAAHGYTHIAADVLIWGAYTAIPLVLAYFVSRRQDVPLTGLFWLFAAFIFACGTNHLVEAALFWWPAYRLSAVVKVVTAVVSWCTVLALIPATPKALALPGLAAVNADLEREIKARQQTEHDLNRLNARLEAKNKDITEFISIVTHDLKHPIFAIKTMQEMLKRTSYRGLGDAEQRYVDQTVSECDRMMEMLGQLSSLARIERTEVNAERVDLRELVERCVERFRGQMDQAGCVLEVDVPSQPVTIARQQVEESLNNLIDNALKHGCRGGVAAAITIQGVVGSHEASLTVSDRGPGVDPAHHQRVFQLFQKAGVDQRQGSGVGLASVRRLMQRIGGSVTLESAPGQGARFTLTFPVR